MQAAVIPPQQQLYWTPKFSTSPSKPVILPCKRHLHQQMGPRILLNVGAWWLNNTCMQLSSSALVSIGEGLPALSQRLIEKIKAGEYVDFSDLPPSEGESRSSANDWDTRVLLLIHYIYSYSYTAESGSHHQTCTTISIVGIYTANIWSLLLY